MRYAKHIGCAAVAISIILSTGCAHRVRPPKYGTFTAAQEAEYLAYKKTGTGRIEGQAFLVQNGGGVVKAAGRSVTLDPATSIGEEWWIKAGHSYRFRDVTPQSDGFYYGRRQTIADADGKFKFENLAPGRYYIQTVVTWEIGGYHPTQGGLLGGSFTVEDGKTTEVILRSILQ